MLTLTDGHLGQSNFVTQSLLVLVEDINDNTPTFKPHQPSLAIREDAAPGIISTLEATDADEGAYGQVIYHLQESDSDKHLFGISTVGGKAVLRLIGMFHVFSFFYGIYVLFLFYSILRYKLRGV